MSVRLLTKTTIIFLYVSDRLLFFSNGSTAFSVTYEQSLYTYCRLILVFGGLTERYELLLWW